MMMLCWKLLEINKASRIGHGSDTYCKANVLPCAEVQKLHDGNRACAGLDGSTCFLCFGKQDKPR